MFRLMNRVYYLQFKFCMGIVLPPGYHVGSQGYAALEWFRQIAAFLISKKYVQSCSGDWLIGHLVMRKKPRTFCNWKWLLVWYLLGFYLTQWFSRDRVSRWADDSSEPSRPRSSHSQILNYSRENDHRKQDIGRTSKGFSTWTSNQCTSKCCSADFLERSLDPKFFAPARQWFQVVHALGNYRENPWAPGLPHAGLPERKFIFPEFQDLERIVDKLELQPSEVILAFPVSKSRLLWPQLKAKVTDLPIVIPISSDAFWWQAKPMGRASCRAAILHLNKIPHLHLTFARKYKMNVLLLAFKRWMTDFEELSKTAGPHEMTSILNDIDQSRDRCGRPQLKDLITNQVSAYIQVTYWRGNASNIPGNILSCSKNVPPCVGAYQPTYSINHSWNPANRF